MSVQIKRNLKLRCGAAVAFALASFLGMCVEMRAQRACGVGTRVEFEDGTRGVGRIEEIGTAPPHVGWYRVSLSWSPKGEWYPPTFGILIAGTKTRCGSPRATVQKGADPGGKAPRAETNTPAAAGLPSGCPFVEPPGRVTNGSAASAQLFKRVIYEKAAARINPDSITAPKKVGLTFLEFNMGSPYKNTLTSSRFGDKRRHDGAPAGATIYPIKTREMRCDLHGSEVRRWVAEVDHDCFKNRDGEWTCPGRTTKVIENTLIPAK
jgi:hypothetical protein